MKLQVFLLILIFTFPTYCINGQDVISNKSIDPQFIQEANVILTKYASYVQPGLIKFPEPWVEDEREIQNLKRNKVRTINNLMFSADFDRNGELILERPFQPFRFANQVKVSGSINEFKRDENGRLISRQGTNILKYGDVHKRQFYYVGDTLYIKWAIDDVPKGLGLFYENIYIDKDIESNLSTITIYKKESVNSGYLITELIVSGKSKKFTAGDKFEFNAEGLLVGYVNRIIKEEYLYNSGGLRIERKRYIKDQPKDKVQLIRDENGLVSEYVVLEAPFDRSGASGSETRIPYEYTYYDSGGVIR